MRSVVVDYIQRKYKAFPEFLWKRYPEYAVFRHADNKKWFALVARVSRKTLGLGDGDEVDIINIKVDDLIFRDILISQDGIIPGYHMNKQHWVTVLLDGTVPEQQVMGLIDGSFLATASARKKNMNRPSKDWIIPANPKYYDIVHAFDNADVIDWKQGNGIRKGDIVFMYVGAPVSAIMYKCKVIETDIPYDYQDDDLTITALMKIKLLKRYKPDKFTFDVLKDEYDIYAIRGPRGITHSLKEALK